MLITILTYLLYALGGLLLLVVLLALFLLVAPLRYRAEGSIKAEAALKFKASLTPLFIIKGCLATAKELRREPKAFIFGFPLKLTPGRHKEDDQEKTEKMAATKKKKSSKKRTSKSIFARGTIVLDYELFRSGKALLADLIKVLKPEQLELRGRLGFEEPHLTGWLVALTYIFKNSLGRFTTDLEPNWAEEQTDLELILSGKIIIAALLFRVGRFLLAQKIKNIMSGFKNKADSALTESG